MTITDRQKDILNKIIGEYISSAQPVSSKLLEKKYDFGVCPATIRIEMQKLTDDGFISQPHTSAGRIPTDKGYRFFVNNLFERGLSEEEYDTGDLIEKEMGDTMKFIQHLTKGLAETTSNLALSYLFNDKILWKEGWGDIIQEPEFKETKLIYNLARIVDNFEDEIKDVDINFGVKVYIGKENPFSRSKEFSTIIARCRFPEKEEGFLAIVGPKRMDYDKNINLINSLIKLMEDYG
ncbi:MAG: hypothetical protein WC514_00770 [Candidatus Paceibacterota bacterium]